MIFKMKSRENIENYTIGNYQLSILNCQLAIDPLWEKYRGWNSYQYCMNNPIWAKDYNGKAVQGAALPVPAAGGILIGAGLLSELLGQAVKSGALEAAGTAMQDMGNNLINSFEEAVKSEHVSFVNKSILAPTDATTSTNPSKAELEAKYNEFIENSKPMEANNSKSKEKSKEKTEESDKREHKKGMRESTRNTHEKGQARKNQKYTDKKRQNYNWQQNPNKR